MSFSIAVNAGNLAPQYATRGTPIGYGISTVKPPNAEEGCLAEKYLFKCSWTVENLRFSATGPVRVMPDNPSGLKDHVIETFAALAQSAKP